MSLLINHKSKSSALIPQRQFYRAAIYLRLSVAQALFDCNANNVQR